MNDPVDRLILALLNFIITILFLGALAYLIWKG
jgi:hypothetical protein